MANIYAIGHIFIVLNCQILNSCCRNLVTLTVTQKSQSGTNSLGRSTYELFYNTSILIYDRCIRLEHAVVGVQSTQWTSWPNARTSIDSYRKQQMGQQATSRRTTRTTLWSPRQGTETSRLLPAGEAPNSPAENEAPDRQEEKQDHSSGGGLEGSKKFQEDAIATATRSTRGGACYSLVLILSTRGWCIQKLKRILKI